MDDQAPIFAFLARPDTHGIDTPVTRIDTHGAVVFLAGPDAYKVKRAVRYPFLDFSTLEKRHAACLGEMAVNGDNAPGLYLGVVPVTRTAESLRLGGSGEVVEWAVHLRRFDETQTLDRLKGAGFAEPLLAALATRIRESHDRAPVRTDPAVTEAFAREARSTLEDLRHGARGLPAPQVAAYADAAGDALRAARPLMEARREAGCIRRCHGDLHLRNIVLIDGAPVLFDAIEFNDAIATCDTLYDLAFLLMDLLHHGLRHEACLLLNRMLWGAADGDIARDVEGLALLPLFLSLRAAIRAKVAFDLAALRGANAEAAEADGRAYFDTARHLLSPDAPPRLVAVGGLSGTGKSTLAARLAPELGAAPGAVHLRSDIERKRLSGCGELDRLPPDAYAPDVTARTYARLRDLAGHALAAGRSVVVDAVHAHPDERAAIAAVARTQGAAFTGLWLEAPADLLRARVEARRNDASDATPEVVDRQERYEIGELAWARLDARLPLPELGRQAATLIRG